MLRIILFEAMVRLSVTSIRIGFLALFHRDKTVRLTAYEFIITTQDALKLVETALQKGTSE